MLDKFAEELKAAREKNNISLQQMAAKTRIDLKFLEAIDNGNFAFLPDLYVKAFIKQYAKVVGLDEQETVEKFDAAKEGKLYEKVEEVKTEKTLKEQKPDKLKQPAEPHMKKKPVQTFTDESTLKPPQQSDKNNRARMLTVVGVAGTAIIVLLIFLVFFDNGSDIVVEEKPYEEVLEQTNQRYIEEENQVSQKTAEVISDSMILQISNVDSSDSAWVLVIYDDKVKEDFLLFPKSRKTVSALNNFKLTLGNSGVIKLILNDNSIEFEGRKGSVRHYQINREGIERLHSPPVLTQE